LLVWLDARQRGAQALLRLEDLDPQRCKPAFAQAIVDSLQHLKLCFDAISYQSQHQAAHEQALDTLADKAALYACTCRRDVIAQRCRRQADGAYGYDNACRSHGPLSRAGWRQSPEAVRARLPDASVYPVDTGGLDLRQRPAEVLGDPIVRRRDGSVAYVLASVVDDAAAQIGHIVRGCDLAPLSATQVALQQLLHLPIPTFRHHPVLLDSTGRKWSKSRTPQTPSTATAMRLTGPQIIGRLAFVLGLSRAAKPIEPQALLAQFSWQRVIAHNVCVRAFD
jgi:glutamyl-tRNA synthetase/glutamyl-Q tRNA(Asp) synthetase